jgi:hypothetical protein
MPTDAGSVDVPDDRDPSTRRVDLLVDQVNLLCSKFDEMIERAPPGQIVTVTHRTHGIGAWTAAAVTACFFTFLGLILVAIMLVPDVHDLQAWSDILRSKVARLEAIHSHEQQR